MAQDDDSTWPRPFGCAEYCAPSKTKRELYMHLGIADCTPEQIAEYMAVEQRIKVTWYPAHHHHHRHGVSDCQKKDVEKVHKEMIWEWKSTQDLARSPASQGLRRSSTVQEQVQRKHERKRMRNRSARAGPTPAEDKPTINCFSEERLLEAIERIYEMAPSGIRAWYDYWNDASSSKGDNWIIRRWLYHRFRHTNYRNERPDKKTNAGDRDLWAEAQVGHAPSQPEMRAGPEADPEGETEQEFEREWQLVEVQSRYAGCSRCSRCSEYSSQPGSSRSSTLYGDHGSHEATPSASGLTSSRGPTESGSATDRVPNQSTGCQAAASAAAAAAAAGVNGDTALSRKLSDLSVAAGLQHDGRSSVQGCIHPRGGHTAEGRRLQVYDPVKDRWMSREHFCRRPPQRAEQMRI